MNKISAADLKVNDKFSLTGSRRTFTVLAVVEAHRDDYARVLRVQSSTGTVATVGFTSGATVIMRSL